MKIKTLGEKHQILDRAAADAYTQSINADSYEPSERLPGHDYGPADKPEKGLIKWPPGYWEEYEALRQRAREIDSNANVCVLLNGLFEVRTYRGEKYAAGPQASDRLQALRLFIAKPVAS